MREVAAKWDLEQNDLKHLKNLQAAAWKLE